MISYTGDDHTIRLMQVKQNIRQRQLLVSGRETWPARARLLGQRQNPTQYIRSPAMKIMAMDLTSRCGRIPKESILVWVVGYRCGY